MTTEDYCSYEVAKLLKEKGFNECCRAFRSPNGHLFYSSHDIKNFEDGKTIGGAVAAPTLQMVMKWLREKHKILITIIPQEIGLGVDKLCYGIYKITEDLYQPLCNGKTDSLVNSYEEAVEAAIKYCLEHLI